MNNTEIIGETSVLLNDKTTISVSIKRYIYFGIKRLVDIVLAVLGVIVLLPLMLMVKIVNICCGDFGPLFYKQKRIGKNGKSIYIYKFRTMIPNADEVLKKLLKDKKYLKEWKLNQKFEHDPRITKAGKFLRKTSLDEVPQFINVLKGDMSLIGPRPLIEGELDSHNGNHELYESIRPGVTGWWASHGRSATTYSERLALEYYYIRNQSLVLDIKCVFATIKAVICRTGVK